MTKTYDFIVVGAGPAGCAVARRLADTAKKPRVLLVEAGSDNRSRKHYRSGKLRFLIAFTQPKLSWNYFTTEQANLNNRRISQVRGKGLGGTSSINYAAWLVGSGKDYDDWAELTGDDSWRWPAVQKRLKKIENVHQDVAPEPAQYLGPFTHSTTGRIDLTYPRVWDANIEPATFEATTQMGWPLTSDLNSGNPVGMGIAPVTYANGSRITAAEAYLTHAPSNLTILSDAAIAKVLFRNKRAIGVRTVDGRKLFARREVIISAGTLNTPQILMLSGIGPTSELNKHHIPVIHHLPGVGQHLIDHLYAPITQLLTPTAARVANPSEHDPSHDIGPQMTAGFLRLPSLPSRPEFHALPPSQQSHLSDATVPHFEIMCIGHPFDLGDYRARKTDKFRTIVANLMNLQSEGSVTLTSADPTDPPTINGNYLSHPFDRRLAIDVLRTQIEFASQPAFAASTQTTVLQPASSSDDHLLEFWRQRGGSLWHMAGTVKMGRDDDDPLVCLDPAFRVRGVQALRVVDMSVAPALPCNHTQSTAYIVGETAAEKLIAEYRLDEVEWVRANL